jgi:hypothetical protein
MKGYKHLTDDEKARIVECHNRLKNTRMVAEELGMSYFRVASFLARYGIPKTGAQRGACHHRRAEVLQWAREGMSQSEIARRVGTNRTSVRRFLALFGEKTCFQQVGPNASNWRGGRVIDKSGYVLLYMPDHPNASSHGYYREHRYVMEQKLGRLLEPQEVVHHIDGNCENNHPDNLELFASNGEHLRATLTGVPCPARARRYGSNRKASEPSAGQWHQCTAHPQASPGTSAPRP